MEKYNSLIKDFEEIAQSSNLDLIQENANTDGVSPMGMMSLFASSASKYYTIENLLSDDVKEAYLNGYIHIHDLDFYTTGTSTCCQIPLGKVLKGGFDTGHGHMREPNNIMSALALTSIILQANQNQMHGGQAIPMWDYDLAPYVTKTFNKKIELVREINRELSENELIVKAWDLTDKEVYQACEAFIHNSNSMHSRGGSQTPFISINFGTDTSKEGRMLIKNLLLATQSGLGDGETPIFPISVFKVKEGINYNPTDPNYDLFKLALETTGKRLFPNFVFIDAPHNIQYYDGTPESEIASMGCVDGKEVITYKYKNKLYVESFERMYSRFDKVFNNLSYGLSEYIDLKEVEIFDSNKNTFVICHRVIKNPDKGDWVLVKMDNGRSLLTTSDHPLPVKDKGRLSVNKLNKGDMIPITFKQYSEDNIEYGNKKAWLDAMLLCDGCYQSGTLRVSLGLDEYELVAKTVLYLKEIYDLDSKVIEQNRGVKGNYFDVTSVNTNKNKLIYLEKLFGGINKNDRQIPNDIFSAKLEDRLAFIGGLIDSDGHVKNVHNGARVELGSVNKELALQQLALIQTVGIPAKMYLNKYSSSHERYRYKIEFYNTEELNQYITCNKKNVVMFNCKNKQVQTSDYAKVVELIYLGNLNKSSYDVTTESDHFDVSGVNSHNCRTRTIGNIHGKETPIGRGNLSFSSINLPLLALESEGVTDFFKKLSKYIDLTIKQLHERYEYQSGKTAANFKFLYSQGLWWNGEELNPTDKLKEILKQGTLSVGFVGLAECLVALTGNHHGDSQESWNLGYDIVSFMRDKMDEAIGKYQLNYSLLATPAESFAGKALRTTRKKHGVIKGVTDRNYFTNSFHIPVYHKLNAIDKIKKEAPFHELTNAGHITYIELDGDASKNVQALETIVRAMKESGIGYGSINHPVDRCKKCKHKGIIDNECPKCGNNNETEIERIRRITGYLVGTLDKWNSSKRAEESQRVKHQ